MSKAIGNTYHTFLVDMIRDIESLMLEGKLVLVGDDEQPLKPSNEVSRITSSGVVSNEHIMEDVVGGTLNATNTRMYVDVGQETNGKSLSSFPAILNDDVKKLKLIFVFLQHLRLANVKL